ncbi:hypothetical protein LRS73_16610 [Methylobacterium currus]|uniref:hypothetical protein n=1 Tax=Methylobacterium currus TaxID=2051553 RepID=UPI001E28BFF7|nr:hypothetical protein [Methylobacterium currus]UHC14198.1 hypothetical protein LRS73_16610 [Methylobacterium currus]
MAHDYDFKLMIERLIPALIQSGVISGDTLRRLAHEVEDEASDEQFVRGDELKLVAEQLHRWAEAGSNAQLTRFLKARSRSD